MKVIVTGATGFVGGEVLRQCIRNPAITSIVVVTRKELAPEVSNNSKVKVIIHKDFEEYSEPLLRECAGAEGCLWAMGGRASAYPDVATATKVNVDYTLAAANAFAKSLVPELGDGKKFRFVLCSGMGAEMDQSKSLWMMPDTRRIKGQVERGLFEIAEQHSRGVEVYTVRPGGILPVHAGLVQSVMAFAVPCVRVDELGAVMIHLSQHGSTDRIVDNTEIARRGKELLR
ncbi:MAG: hypothetical protein M1830_005932 [Pleopsidium flavum]|nr:MAG: hypothetical protein M1830_005932 [Pleopsidium flavum]